MRTERLFGRQPEVIWVPSLHAFVHTRLQLGVDGDEVAEDLAEAIRAGDVADDDEAVAAFCADYFDLAASVFPVVLAGQRRWQRVEE